jgi:hypothetical protein
MSSKKRKREIEKKKKRKEKNAKQKSMKAFSFFDSPKQYVSNKKTFGLCDKEPPPHLPAYLDEKNGKEWIGVVDNLYQSRIRFVALDNCIKLLKPDGKQDNCCDGMLDYNATVIFAELTTRTDKKWRKEKDKQLRATIEHFEKTTDANIYTTKRAYIANNSRPKFKTSYEIQANKFWKDTGYILRIQNRIIIS